MTERIAVVTGAASGIGLQIGQDLLKHGYKVISLDIRRPEKDNGIHYIDCDLSLPQKVQSSFQEIREKYGKTTVLVNNSGLQFMAPFDEFPVEKWKLLQDVMLTGTFVCSQEAFKDMKASRFGRIVNISSIHGKLASPFKAAYVAAKHGVLGLSKVIALEGAPYKITSNTICPGFVDTPLMRQQVTDQAELNKISEEEVIQKVFLKDQAVKELTTPAQVSALVQFLISDQASTITGEAFNVSGGWGMGL